VMLDVTERNRARAELADQRYQLREIIDVVPHAVFVKDADGRFLLVNREFASLYGRTPAEIEGMLESDLLEDADQAARFRAADLEVMRTCQPMHIAGQPFTTPAGEVLLTDTVKVPFRRAGSDQPAVLGLTRDITVERAREQQLRRAERLASVGTLLGGVAHELNNPLAAIKAFASLMLMDPRDDEDREALETVQREADRAAKIVADLRLLARESQEAAPARRQPVDLAEVVRHVLKLRGYALETRNILVELHLPQPLPPVLGDRGELEQVVLNLVVNAEQALASAGPGLEPRLTLGARPYGDRMVLTVADNGPGIQPEHLDHIFDPFWTTKAPGEGTGLGLSLVHTLVTEHGGVIGVESRPGHGATFTAELPIAPAPVPARSLAAAPGTAGRALRILVVDDEEPVRRTLVRYLSRRGHRVDQAAEGAQALEMVDRPDGKSYDVILSDLRMPGMGGAELLERLRARGDGVDQRVVFITGDAASADSAQLLARLGVPVLNKPFELDRVAAVVERSAAER
jgi:PAS domain S-box-containing protein